MNKTPENENKRSSPRSLRPNLSKRKLDLDRLIDQIPDKEFISIKKSNANLFSDKKQNGSSRRSSQKANKKNPLTEHQKEVRKQKTFIPIEVQSVFSVINDSQSAFTLDDDTQSSNIFSTSMKGFS